MPIFREAMIWYYGARGARAVRTGWEGKSRDFVKTSEWAPLYALALMVQSNYICRLVGAEHRRSPYVRHLSSYTITQRSCM